MTRQDFERRRRRLDEELRAGIEALETAHRLQVRALEVTWTMLSREDPQTTAPLADAPAPPDKPPAPVRSERRSSGDLKEEIEDAFAGLPDVFDRNDVCRALGYDPDRSSLYRTLQNLVAGGIISIQTFGEGRVPTRYAKRTAHP